MLKENSEVVKRNQLFIHPTDKCNMNCAFCIYKERHENQCVSELKMCGENAQSNIAVLIAGAQHIAFSGGGEPLFNIDFIVDSIKTVNSKKFLITTGLGLPIDEIENGLSRINDACKISNSKCVIRISVDSFHKNLDFSGNTDTVFKWFVDKRWDCVRTCFIRGIVSEKRTLLRNLKSYCRQNHWSFLKIRSNKYTYAVIINKQFFQLILRPTIYPTIEQFKSEPNVRDYIKDMIKIDSEPVYLGVPRSCRGCKGCDMWKANTLNGIDISITACGDVYLYGAEIIPIGNILNEKLSFDLLEERVFSSPELMILRKTNVAEVVDAFENDPIVGNIVKQINYPFAIIRELMPTHSSDVHRILQEMIDRNG